jgi:hypothetical protein
MATKVYKYGLLAPTAGGDVIAEQCELAWRASIAMLRAHEAYRVEREALQRQLSSLCDELAAVRQQIAEDRKTLRGLKTGRQEPKDDGAVAVRTRIQMAAQRAKELAPVAKAERQALRTGERMAALETSLEAEYLRLWRAFTAAGLFWGQRQLVASAHDQRVKARGRLRFPDRWGTVGIQIAHGMAPSALANDGRCELTDVQPVPGRKGKPRQRLRLRIGPNDAKAEWPIVLHRPLPEDASIRFVKVTCKRIGREIKWDAHFTINVPDVPVAAVVDPKVVTVRPTFTQVGGEIIVAEMADAGGPLSPEALHPAVSGAVERARGLQAVRDKARDSLLAEIAARKERGESVPPVLPATIARWESCDRLRQFVLGPWSRAAATSPENAGELFVVALAWAKHDLHLWDWERHAAETSVARRTHLYRCYAAGLAERYDTVVVPSVNYAEMAQRRAKPEQERELSKQASRQRVVAAPGLLRALVVQAFQSRGRQVIEVPANGSPAELLALARTVGRVKTVKVRAAKFAKRHRAKTVAA